MRATKNYFSCISNESFPLESAQVVLSPPTLSACPHKRNSNNGFTTFCSQSAPHNRDAQIHKHTSLRQFGLATGISAKWCLCVCASHLIVTCRRIVNVSRLYIHPCALSQNYASAFTPSETNNNGVVKASK